MATTKPTLRQYYKTGGINTYVNPVQPEQDGLLIHAVNVDNFPLAAKTKRYGYQTYLNKPDSGTVTSLWQWRKNDGTSFWNYRASGSLLYYSTQGTGNWTVAGNGTITNGYHIGHAVLNDTMIIGDGVGSTRHTTNGTSFTNTTGAPLAQYFEQYQNRIHAQGTASTNFYSSANDPTNWQTSGTSDSSSFTVPGGGKLMQSYKVGDRLVLPKNSGQEYQWDGYSLVDLATQRGPASSYAIGDAEGYKMYINRFGEYGYGGGQAELLSAPVQRFFQSYFDGAIVGSEFEGIPGIVHYNEYYASIGDVTDEFTKRPIASAILKHDFQKDQFGMWSFANKPTAFMSAINSLGYSQMYFGDGAGNTFELSGQLTSDNGTTIFSEMVFFFNFGFPEYDKDWNYWRGTFNPGCQARVQIACANFFEYSRLQWKELGNAQNGFVEYKFPAESRSKYLFVRIYDASVTAPWSFYGQSISALVNTNE